MVYIVTCQGGGVSMKPVTRTPTKHTLGSWLNYNWHYFGQTNIILLRQGRSGTPQYIVAVHRTCLPSVPLNSDSITKHEKKMYWVTESNELVSVHKSKFYEVLLKNSSRSVEYSKFHERSVWWNIGQIWWNIGRIPWNKQMIEISSMRTL